MVSSPRLILPFELLKITAALISRIVAAEGTNEHIAAYIRHGINSTGNDVPRPSDMLASPNVSSTSPFSTTTQGLESIVTGSGSAFASSCQAALWSWKEASESYGSQHEYLATSTGAGTTYSTYTANDYSAGIKVSSLTTLCDGYPRAIGTVEFSKTTTITESFAPFTLTTSLPGPFTTPMPCSIGPSDCAELWESFASSTSASLVFETKTVLEPPCQTVAGNTTVPFESAACTSDGGSNGGVVGSEIRLLYWPVRTAAPSTPDSYFCSTYNGIMVQPSYLSGTRTSNGPNTFVTGELTITSPAIGISFSGLHRRDGCGPTLDYTIVTLEPSQLYSVRGARAAYGWYPFNLADLNWKCESPSGVFTLQDTNETSNGAQCYQEVAAQAYFGAQPQYDRAAGHSTGLTILNDYRPFVAPGQDVGREMLQSLWGTTASWWIDGIWDPPIALTQASEEAMPTLPGGGDASPTTMVSETPVFTTPAIPAHATFSDGSPTALPDLEPSTRLSGSGPIQESWSGDVPASKETGVGESQPMSTSGLSGDEQSQDVQPQYLPSTQSRDESFATESVNMESYASGSLATTGIAQPVIVPGQESEIYWKSQTLSIGGPAKTINDQIVSAGAEELIVESQGASLKAATAMPYSTLSSDASRLVSRTTEHITPDYKAGQTISTTSPAAERSEDRSSSDSMSKESNAAAPSESSATSFKTFQISGAVLFVTGLFFW